MKKIKSGEMFEDFVQKIASISSNKKLAFISTLVIGFATHLYKFTNYLPNNDSLYALFSKQDVIESGRWFLEFPAWFSSNFDLPMIIGILSIVYIALAVVILIELFQVENKFVIILISGVIVAFPSISAIFFYGYTSDAYMFALLMATFAVYLSRFEEKKISRLLVSALLLCLACATYQAFIPYALVLIIIYFAYNILLNKYSTKQLLLYILKECIIIVFGMVAYFVIWKLIMKVGHLEATDYLGISGAGFGIQTIISGFKRATAEVLYFLFESNLSRKNLSFYCAANCLLIVAIALGLFAAIINNKIYKTPSKLVLLIVSFVFSFPCIILWDLVSEDTVAEARTLVAMSLYVIFAVLLYERWFSIKIKNLFGVFMIAVICNYSIMANVGYFTLNRAWQTSVYKASELMCDIHTLEDKNEIERIAFIGQGAYSYPIVNSETLRTQERTNYYSRYGLLSFGGDLIFDNVHAYLYLVNYCGLDLAFVEDEELLEIQENELTKELKCWPANNCMTIIDDTLVIKLSDNTDYWWLK